MHKQNRVFLSKLNKDTKTASHTVQKTIEELLKEGFDVEGLKARKFALQDTATGNQYAFTKEIKNASGTDSLEFELCKKASKEVHPKFDDLSEGDILIHTSDGSEWEVTDIHESTADLGRVSDSTPVSDISRKDIENNFVKKVSIKKEAELNIEKEIKEVILQVINNLVVSSKKLNKLNNRILAEIKTETDYSKKTKLNETAEKLSRMTETLINVMEEIHELKEQSNF